MLFTPRGRPLALCFTGRAEGKEAVTCGRHSLHVPFGWFTHFQHAVPQAPDLSWARRVKEWAKPEGVPIQFRIAGEAPWERIEQHRTIAPPRGYRQAEMKAILDNEQMQELYEQLTDLVRVCFETVGSTPTFQVRIELQPKSPATQEDIEKINQLLHEVSEERKFQ